MIDTIALLHQFQRPVKNTLEAGQTIEYIEATLDDIALANELAHEVLGRSLDELPPQTRRVLGLLDRFVAERARALGLERSDVRFTRRELREASAIGDTQLRIHLERLIALEYVLVHRGARGASFVYELVYDGAGADGKPFVPGLINLEALKAATTTANLAGAKADFAGQKANLAGSTRGESGLNAGGRGVAEIAETLARTTDCDDLRRDRCKTHILSDEAHDASYTHTVLPLAAPAR